MSYTDSRRYYTQRPIIHSRESSIESRTSSSSRSSTDARYASSFTSMANGGYNRETRVERNRVPDNGLCTLTRLSSQRPTANRYVTSDRHYVTTTQSRNGQILVH